MPETRLADVIVPEIFNQYVVERTAQLSALYQSGIVEDVTDLISADMGGDQVHMPFFQDLQGDDEIVDDTQDLTVNAVNADKDVAPVLYRAKVFGGTDLAADLAGADPMAVIADRFADYWARRRQAALLAVLNGATSASNFPNVLDISALTGGAEIFDGESFIDAKGKLGDVAGRLTGVGMHSDTVRHAEKQNLIEFIQPSEDVEPIPFYQGKRVVEDDSMPVTDGVYTTYLFGPGAVGWSYAAPKTPVEPSREPLKGGGMEYLVQRTRFCMHARGIRWAGTPAKATASNAELATAGNWNRVYEPKNVRIVAFKHRLTANAG